MTYAENIFSDGELLVEDLLIQLQQEWETVLNDTKDYPCLLAYTPQDFLEHEKQFALWARSVCLRKDFLGKSGKSHIWDGWIAHEQFEAGKAKMRELQHGFITENSSKLTNLRRKGGWMFGHLPLEGRFCLIDATVVENSSQYLDEYATSSAPSNRCVLVILAPLVTAPTRQFDDEPMIFAPYASATIYAYIVDEWGH